MRLTVHTEMTKEAMLNTTIPTQTLEQSLKNDFAQKIGAAIVEHPNFTFAKELIPETEEGPDGESVPHNAGGMLFTCKVHLIKDTAHTQFKDKVEQLYQDARISLADAKYLTDLFD